MEKHRMEMNHMTNTQNPEFWHLLDGSLYTRGPLSWLPASLLHNEHLVGTGEASRQSLHRAQCCTDTATSRREPGEWGRGARESQACALLSLIWLHAAAMTPSPVGTLHASQAQSLLSSPIPLTQMGSTHSHILLTHTLSHTLTHS